MKMATARVIKHFIVNRAAEPSVVLDKWVRRSSKSVRLTWQYVENQYHDTKKYQEMKDFYKRMKELKLPFVERAVHKNKEAFNDVQLTIRLKPVGVQCTPRTVAELRQALKCIFSFVRSFHHAGYMHCDIRWSNIVKVGDDWYVIDCTEFSHREDEPAKRLQKSLKINEAYVFSTERPWTKRHDYYQFGKLIVEAGLNIGGTDLYALSMKLLDKTVRKVTTEEINAIINADDNR
jgi:hypothetical protein